MLRNGDGGMVMLLISRVVTDGIVKTLTCGLLR